MRLMFAWAAIAAARLEVVPAGKDTSSVGCSGTRPFGPTGLMSDRWVLSGSRSGSVIPRRALPALFLRLLSRSLSRSIARTSSSVYLAKIGV